MEIKVGGQWEMSTPKVCDHCFDHSIDIQRPGIVSKAVRSASSGDVSLAMSCAPLVDMQYAVNGTRAAMCV